MLMGPPVRPLDSPGAEALGCCCPNCGTGMVRAVVGKLNVGGCVAPAAANGSVAVGNVVDEGACCGVGNVVTPPNGENGVEID